MEGCLDFQTIDLPAGFREDFDIMESVDRVATGDSVAMVSGFLKGLIGIRRWDAIGEATTPKSLKHRKVATLQFGMIK